MNDQARMSFKPDVYPPIKPYQTRIIRLHGDDGDPKSQVVCDLYSAYLLHPKLGLGVRPLDGEEYATHYDALSYTWGEENWTEEIICNKTPFNVTPNLLAALRELRRRKDETRHIWVDAICINQKDAFERADQVANMLQIYQMAEKVIAWLGSAPSNVEKLLNAAPSIGPDFHPESPHDIESIIAGIEYLYNRPWFKRIWVQQEIHAAANLEFQCGNLRFEWPLVLSSPRQLLKIPSLSRYSDTEPKRRRSSKKVDTPEHILAQLGAVSKVEQLHASRLNCFEVYSVQHNAPPDLVETLLETGTLNATDSRDHIYGVLGMTEFPAKPMPILDWVTARQRHFFIPIDYNTEMSAILSAVTWNILVQGGLSILAKFKVFNDKGDATFEQNLPSWVIDWRLSARLFQSSATYKEYRDNMKAVTLRNAWAREAVIGRSDQITIKPGFEPVQHFVFCKDNMNYSKRLNELLLHGTVDARYHAREKRVWERKRFGREKAIWQLDVEVAATDAVVFVAAFRGRYSASPSEIAHKKGGLDENGGLWLLRPVRGHKFKLVACLPFVDVGSRLLYWYWDWSPKVEEFAPATDIHQYRPLAARPVQQHMGLEKYRPPQDGEDGVEYQTFTII